MGSVSAFSRFSSRQQDNRSRSLELRAFAARVLKGACCDRRPGWRFKKLEDADCIGAKLDALKAAATTEINEFDGVRKRRRLIFSILSPCQTVLPPFVCSTPSRRSQAHVVAAVAQIREEAEQDRLEKVAKKEEQKKRSKEVMDAHKKSADEKRDAEKRRCEEEEAAAAVAAAEAARLEAQRVALGLGASATAEHIAEALRLAALADAAALAAEQAARRAALGLGPDASEEYFTAALWVGKRRLLFFAFHCP